MKFNGKNISIGKNVKLGKNVRIGDNTVIYDNVEIAENTTICNNCVIGESLADYYTNKNYKNPKTKIGANSLIRSHSIIYAAVETGTNFQTGHRVVIREKSKFGNYCMIGTMSDIQGFVKFGDYCRLHSSVHICQYSEIGNFVFIYPFVVFTNDPHPPSTVWKGPKVGNYTQIAVSSVINSAVKIGSNCLVAANSFIKDDMPDYSVFGGSPAKKIADVREIKSKQLKGMHYPWMNNFSKGMPWEKMGFEKWEKKYKQ
ncbi:MAG: UDP-3-O-(3-hydroxymyristoyl)glucosamine N-acyltransferase [Bacteroidia bacterium]|nr:UDP-3-O-(3-hydroxymyristoyl)glucosamine N-acyltransferase [Bacteroidia bacterium]